MLACPTVKRRLLVSLAALLFVSTPWVAAAADETPEGLVEATRQRLAELVAHDTVNPPGNERALCDAVAEQLRAEGIEVEVLGPEGPRANLLARLPASRRTGKAPLLIVAHIDVVNFRREAWTTDPMTLTEREGYLYGRGVIDNKGMASAGIEILLRLHRDRVPLERDVVLLLAADEEAGGRDGTAWLLKHHPQWLQAAYVLNEGGDVRIVGDKVAYVGLQTTEKISRKLRLIAKGQDGHSSMPLPDNAIARLGLATAAAAEVEFPMRTLATTRVFAEGVADTLPAPLGDAVSAMGTVQPGATVPESVVQVLQTDPFFNAFYRTTCVPTLIDGGTRSNALPSEAVTTINCRLLPDESLQDVAASLEQAIAPFSVELQYSDKAKVSPVSPESGAFFRASREAVASVWPGAVVVPFMSTGGTDCRRFRTAGTPCYGLLPFPLTAEDERRMHGTDERLTVEALGEGVRFLWRLVLGLAAR
ncbi:MAG TPA: peptidase M20 [Deltaproteobacteria bacterium]|nr:peptidase M20 [Deltaproteobacteria bacterium]HCP47863.1 peptidase M20 [Deltaproteobacteria bacterium]